MCASIHKKCVQICMQICVHCANLFANLCAYGHPNLPKAAPKLAPSRLKVAPRLAIASICSWSSCLNLQRPGVRGVGLVNTSMQQISQKFDSLSLAMVLACSHFSCCGYCLKYWKSAIYTLRALATWLCSHVNQAQGTTAC